MIFFSTDIYQRAGLDEMQAQSATLGMGAMNVLMTIISVVLVEKAGRKTLQLIGLSGMFVTTVLLTLCLALKVSDWAGDGEAGGGGISGREPGW